MEASKKYYNYIIIANDFLAVEEYTKAFDSFEKALKFASSGEQKIDVLFEMADIYLIFEKYSLAREIYLKILNIDSLRSGAYYGLALCNDFLKGDIKDTIKYYELAIKYDANYDRAYYYLALAYDRVGEKQKALELFSKCVELDDMDYISYNDMGAIYEELKEYEKAKFFFEKSLEINPNYFRALFNMGVIFGRMGNINKALSYYKEALEESKDSYIYLNMSAAYIEKRDYRSAVEILTEGIHYNAKSVNLYYNRACSKVNLGDRKSAIVDLKRAIDLNEDVVDWAKNDPDLCDIIKEHEKW
ncbi:Tfp pilus assembly protein PilF [Anaerosphaera aminiphila DSM 21120]|uniref:Tfp pilus assembly protein PilF n=1 Tax=Anaerosphaera aminiphila DSM 21120 TaxID=1120995 RepID=A0A1M5RP34_9FIRM|nr:tetratricopeptide repeat protein [Anaerosphaera aminiphila]SHH28087.1 Tfp pilus assembly protein PilF [Anaerosphaera aminiphila DSM 21120]